MLFKVLLSTISIFSGIVKENVEISPSNCKVKTGLSTNNSPRNEPPGV